MNGTSDTPPPSGDQLVQTTRELLPGFAARADRHDREASFPTEDWRDLVAAGLHAAAVPRAFGGLGVGPLQGDAHTLWRMTSAIAEADLSMARCWEGHANSMVMIDGMASPAQKARWFRGVVEDGEAWAAWSGEPQVSKPGEARRFGVTTERADGGWVLRGTKVFATSAPACARAVLLVDPAGPGGARHSGAGDGLLLLVCTMADPSITCDASWWDPMGMRATASHLVRFDGTFIPDADVFGTPGQYLREHWQTYFVPHYAASFLGGAAAAYDYTVAYLRAQGRQDDALAQLRVGRMRVHLDTGRLWLAHVARLWDAGADAEARLAGSSCRWAMEQLAEAILRDAVHVCGARALVRPSALERIHRDLTTYFRHDDDDRVVATVGRASLGESFDPSFHAP